MALAFNHLGDCRVGCLFAIFTHCQLPGFYCLAPIVLVGAFGIFIYLFSSHSIYQNVVYKQISGQIQERLKIMKAQFLLASWIDALRKNADIKTYEAVLNGMGLKDANNIAGGLKK